MSFDGPPSKVGNVSELQMTSTVDPKIIRGVQMTSTVDPNANKGPIRKAETKNLYQNMPFQLPFTLFCASDLHLDLIEMDAQVYGTTPSQTVDTILATLVQSMPAAEVCVLAGDIGDLTSPRCGAFFKQCAQKYKLVLFVPGNHEFRYATEAQMRDTCNLTGVQYLDKDVFEYKGVRFLGATLWTQLDDDDRYGIAPILDFKFIPDFYFEDWQRKHKQAREFLVRELGKGGKQVVISHHAPSRKCIPPSYQNDVSNVFYATNLEAWMCSPMAPVAWISGHTHWPIAETVGKTLLVSNPMLLPSYKSRPAWTDPQTYWTNAN